MGFVLSGHSTICFEISDETRGLLSKKAKSDGTDEGAVIHAALDAYLAVDAGFNRREHSRIAVEMSAVARPMDGEVGTAILPGRVLDVSAGGLKLQCEYDGNEIQRLLGVGGMVEIIFTVPEKEYPVCFTCEVKHIDRKEASELGCQFVSSTGDSLEVLKSIINPSL